MKKHEEISFKYPIGKELISLAKRGESVAIEISPL
jgi:hypothetical protein